jgi:hypothetical protein
VRSAAFRRVTVMFGRKLRGLRRRFARDGSVGIGMCCLTLITVRYGVFW